MDTNELNLLLVCLSLNKKKVNSIPFWNTTRSWTSARTRERTQRWAEPARSRSLEEFSVNQTAAAPRSWSCVRKSVCKGVCEFIGLSVAKVSVFAAATAAVSVSKSQFLERETLVSTVRVSAGGHFKALLSEWEMCPSGLSYSIDSSQLFVLFLGFSCRNPRCLLVEIFMKL